MKDRLRFSYHNLGEAFVSPVTVTPLESGVIRLSSPTCASLLQLPDELLQPNAAEAWQHPEDLGLVPVAMKYAGHQFGHYNPELGDGRGLLLGEIQGKDGKWYDLHLKGAGRTPFSRFGDGRAVLRSTLREFLVSEAMYHLKIPTTRALFLISSDETVQRETREPAAMLLRVAESHVRFGHFEHFYYSRKPESLKKLADYVILRHFPCCQHSRNPYEALFSIVVERTAQLIAKWQAVGFCHGVLNTDNLSIIGLTLDFGPFAFLDTYQEDYICNLTDEYGRYAFNQQPGIGLWNLNALAHSLSELIPQQALKEQLERYQPLLEATYDQLMSHKLGLFETRPGDRQLITSLLSLLEEQRIDFTMFFRSLSHYRREDDVHFLKSLSPQQQNAVLPWLQQYNRRLHDETLTDDQRQQHMQQVNPAVILRNHYAQRAIEQAHLGDFSYARALLAALAHPFEESSMTADFVNPPPPDYLQQPLSCSS